MTKYTPIKVGGNGSVGTIPNKPNIDELTQVFVNAVENEIKKQEVPKLTTEAIKGIYGSYTSEESVNELKGYTKMFLFLRDAGRVDVERLITARFGDASNDGKSSGDNDPVAIAETYSKIAEQKGLTFKFRNLVPKELKKPEMLSEIKKRAPTFAKLCR